MVKAKKKVKKKEDWRERWADVEDDNQRLIALLDDIAAAGGGSRTSEGLWVHHDLPELIGRLKRERDHACESGVNRAVYEELERERDRLMEERDELRARLASEGLEVLKLKVQSA